MSDFSGAASGGYQSTADSTGYSESNMGAGAWRPVISIHHAGHWRPHQQAVHVQRLSHQGGCSGHPPVLQLSHISVLIQQVPGAERAHRPHVHHQQWVARAKPISITWWLGSRSAILSEGSLSDVQNMILRVKSIQTPWQPTCCRGRHVNKHLRKSKDIILVLIQSIKYGTYNMLLLVCQSGTTQVSSVISDSFLCKESVVQAVFSQTKLSNNNCNALCCLQSWHQFHQYQWITPAPLTPSRWLGRPFWGLSLTWQRRWMKTAPSCPVRARTTVVRSPDWAVARTTWCT